MKSLRLSRISGIRVGVRDLERARAFFRDCVGLEEAFANEQIVRFKTGDASLLIEPVEADDPEAEDLVGRYTGITFAEGNAQAAYEALASRGVEFLGPPERMAWGGIFAHFRDPDGNVFTIVEYPKA